ncbi:uncharacterized protein LOC6523968 [Drosophila yakuba]|uniref:Uncharacterized protein n=1 Tax=Drosophila yakuba TaxID=7245 RepID=B4PY75_DROYA|nr:uncharacterized protein LOC6523968 [Drosophila yakuba]EDX00948.1 uncharacterized protein Dyak_GE16718 [Drosophila yakuba]
MAEKKSEDQKDNASGFENRTSRVGAQGSQQEQNNAIFARLFATLDAEHRKLRELEERRSQLIEEMKHLRTLLFTENKKLRQTVAPIPGSSPLPIPATGLSAIVKNSSEKPSSSGTSPIIKSVRLERRQSNKSVTIAEPPTQNFNTRERPRASSSQGLKQKGNRRSLMVTTRKIKQRITLDNISNTREDMLDEIDESALTTSVGSNLRTLEQRRSELDDREDVDEVLVSLPALFTFMDSQFTEHAILPSDPEPTNDSKTFEVLPNTDQDPSFYLPSADSLFKDILGTDSPSLELNMPEVSLEMHPVGIIECSTNVAEIVENEHETEAKTD